MKIKAILFALAISSLTVFGQGLVSFRNSTVGGTPINVDGNLMPVRGTTSYSFYFVYGLSAGTLNNTSATYLNDTATAGRIESTASSVTLATPGNTATYFQMFAYETAAGSYANAAAAPGTYHSFASSVILLSPNPSVSPNPATPLFGTTVGSTFQGFNMVLTPEPSTIALGVLGLAGLVFVRRRK